MEFIQRHVRLRCCPCPCLCFAGTPGIKAAGVLGKEAAPFLILRVTPVAVAEGVIFLRRVGKMQEKARQPLIERAVEKPRAAVTFHR